MERLWHYLRSVRRIQLHDFSTDQQVEIHLAALAAAHAAAPTAELREDIAAIMRRRPRARVNR
jgi:hypothetical protein